MKRFQVQAQLKLAREFINIQNEERFREFLKSEKG